jgi:hypothetical protein
VNQRSILGCWGARIRIIVGLMLGFLFCRAAVAQSEIVHAGQAKAVIVAPPGAGGLSSLAASELQRYIGELTGARPEIRQPAAIAALPKDEVLILVGGPAANPLVKQAATVGKINFGNLKPEGFLLKTMEVEGRPALVIGGNDEAGTLYGAYDWLERQGIVFQISGDVIPNYRDSVPLNRLDVRSEPSFSQRGFGTASVYETRAIWSYPDIVRFIDQMAKEKLNYLIWHMFTPEPYLEYSYGGEKKLMGDATTWQGGYILPAYNFGSHAVEDYFVGKEAYTKFGKQYMAPDEWQGVQDQDRVFASARDLVQRVIRYAKTRNVKVWIALESLNQFDTNMARHVRRPDYLLPYSPIYGAYICPTDPTVHEINEARFKSLIASYPEAEGFLFWINEQYYATCHHPEDEALFAEERATYTGAKAELLRTHIQNFGNPDEAIENAIGSVHLVQKILEVRDRISPQTKIGVGMWARSFLLPTLDKVLPKNVALVDNETSGVWTPDRVPMEHFGGMGERNRIFVHVGDDDSQMVGMQFHVRLYYHDGLLQGALQNGAQGVAEFGDRFRGEEHLAKYMAEGAWNPQLKPDEFYHDYARRIFGERAEAPMFQAFMALEDMEGYRGYDFQKPHHILMMNCCALPPDVPGEDDAAKPNEELYLVKKYAEQPDPYDGPTFKSWKQFMGVVPDRIELFTGYRELLQKALGHMKTAAAVAAPGSRAELRYLENKTQAYDQMIGTFILWDQALAEFDQAFKLDPRTQREEFLKRLDGSLETFQRARLLARQSAQTFSEVVDNVSDLGILYRLNVFIVKGSDLNAQFMENIDNYHHGKPYLNRVEWEKVFSPLPIIATH